MGRPRKDAPSTYPIHQSSVYVLGKKWNGYNTHLKAYADHHVVYWVMKVFKKTGKYVRLGDNKMRVACMRIPDIPGCHHKYILQDKHMVERSLMNTFYKTGFRVLSTTCPFHDQPRMAQKFYLTVEVALCINLRPPTLAANIRLNKQIAKIRKEMTALEEKRAQMRKTA